MPNAHDTRAGFRHWCQVSVDRCRKPAAASVTGEQFYITGFRSRKQFIYFFVNPFLFDIVYKLTIIELTND
jgi:hypothetical protein